MILPIDPYETRLPPVALGWGSYLPSRGESNSVDFEFISAVYLRARPR